MAVKGWSAMGAGYPERPQESGFHRLQKCNNHYGAATTLYWSALMSAWYIDQDCKHRLGGPASVGNNYDYIAALPQPQSVNPVKDQQEQIDNLLENVVKLWNAVNEQSTQIMKLMPTAPQSTLPDKQYEAAWLAGARAMQSESCDELCKYGYSAGITPLIERISAVAIKAKYDVK